MPYFTIFRKKIIANTLPVVVCVVVLFGAVASRVQATPMYNVTDTQIIHTVQGTDKFYTKKQKGEIRLHLSPFFQHAGAARNDKGRRVPMGERVGKWNMSGLFFGQAAAPLAFASYPMLNNVFGTQIKNDNSIADPAVTIAEVGAITTFNYKNLTNEGDFSLESNIPAFMPTVDVKHEKMGLRGQLSCDFGFGLGVSVKGGVVDYKERPNFDIGKRMRQAVGLDTTAAEPAFGTKEQDVLSGLYKYIFSPVAREKLFKEIDVDASEIRDTCLEDMHMQLFWHFPYEMKEKGELSVTMIPGLAVGAWLPTGKVKDSRRIFSIDTGNGGFYGLTFEGSLGFDYPKLLQASFGAGALVSMSKEFKDYRVPSSGKYVGGALNGQQIPIKQSGIYPWRTTVGITPGVTWYANASLKADGFSGALSFYFDYIYTYHQKDTIHLRESNTTRSEAFKLGPAKLSEESNWKTQLMNFGLDYRINQHLSFGSGLQAMIGGVRVVKTTTVMGSMTLTF